MHLLCYLPLGAKTCKFWSSQELSPLADLDPDYFLLCFGTLGRNLESSGQVKSCVNCLTHATSGWLFTQLHKFGAGTYQFLSGQKLSQSADF